MLKPALSKMVEYATISLIEHTRLVVNGSCAAVDGPLGADELPGGVVVHRDGEAGRRVAVEVRSR